MFIVCVSAQVYLEGVSYGSNILACNIEAPEIITQINNGLSCVMHAEIGYSARCKLPKGECALKKPYDRNTLIRAVSTLIEHSKLHLEPFLRKSGYTPWSMYSIIASLYPTKITSNSKN